MHAAQRVEGKGKSLGRGTRTRARKRVGGQARAVAGKEALPEHAEIVRGRLCNGLKYVVLPNAMPEGRFEAHMEVHAGSVDEALEEQGVAHLVEHITFLGSPRRERLIGSGAKSNAFTDFHHTVFHIHSPHSTNVSSDMLPFTLATLNEVAFHPSFSQRRFDKERSAVLNEASMMNTMDYRLDCKRLQGLHSENNVGFRFPIGKSDWIQSWSVEDPKEFHRRFYFPGNSTVYVVGDFGSRSAEDVVRLISEEFGSQDPGPADASPAKIAALPPVQHSYGLSSVQQCRIGKLEGSLTQRDAPADLYKHQLLQQYNLNIFSKLPLFPVRTREDLRWAYMARLVVSALQFRLSSRCGDLEQQSINIELDYSDSSREGCTVSALTVDAEATDWEQATRIAVEEASKLARGGITQTELERYSNMLLLDSEQLADQAGTIPSADTLDFVMEAEAIGHTVMDQVKGHEVMKEVSQMITLEEVNDTCMEILGFISEYGTPVEHRDPRAGYMTSLVVCAPSEVLDNVPFNLTAEDVERVMLDPEARRFEPAQDVHVPEQLLSSETVANLKGELQPSFASSTHYNAGWFGEQDSREESSVQGPIYQRMLSNGIAVNIKETDNEPAGAAVRLVAFGGRLLEGGDHKLASVAVGARSLQESGSAGGYSREQIELFCMSRLLMLEVAAKEECITIDASFATSKDGMRAALELVHVLVSDPHLSQSAVERTKQQLISSAQALPKSLERYGPHIATASLLEDGDKRVLDPQEDDVVNVTPEDAKAAMLTHFAPGRLELNIVGDVDVAEVDRLLLDVIGTIKLPTAVPPKVPAIEPAPRTTRSPQLRQHSFVLDDSDERGNAWIAGSAPQKWTRFSSESDNGIELKEECFCVAALELLSDMVSSRLFGKVRDNLGLTYDVNFDFANLDLAENNWYTLSVTSVPENIEKALEACKDVMRWLQRSPPRGPELEKSKRRILRRYEGEKKDNQRWLSMLATTQNELVPGSTVSHCDNIIACINNMESGDFDKLLQEFDFSDSALVTVVGVAGQDLPSRRKVSSGNDTGSAAGESKSSASAAAA
jgi:predicted Zn-dependent peptidase